MAHLPCCEWKGVFWAFVLFGFGIRKTVFEKIEVCNAATHTLECSVNSVVMVQAASYGLQQGRCVNASKECTTDGLPIVTGMCSGRRSCVIDIPHNQLDNAISSLPDCSNYRFSLEVEYICLKVQRAVDDHCTLQVPSEGYGFLASYVTANARCGSTRQPWHIQADVNQRINISLYDFDVQIPSDRTLYGLVSQKTSSANVSFYGGVSNHSHIYMSDSGGVDIALIPHGDRYFLIKYEVTGCADVIAPAHAQVTYEREKHSVTIACDDRRQSWILHCQGSRWSGSFGECSASVMSQTPTSTNSADDGPLSAEVTVAVIVGLSVLVVALLCALIFGCCYVYRKRKEEMVYAFPPTLGPYASPPVHPAMVYRSASCTSGPQRGLPYAQSECTMSRMTSSGYQSSNSQCTMARLRSRDDLIHIWETPLPDPKAQNNKSTRPSNRQQAEAASADNDGSTIPHMATPLEPRVAAHSSRGNLLTQDQVNNSNSNTRNSDSSCDEYWAGDHKYFVLERQHN